MPLQRDLDLVEIAQAKLTLIQANITSSLYIFESTACYVHHFFHPKSFTKPIMAKPIRNGSSIGHTLPKKALYLDPEWGVVNATLSTRSMEFCCAEEKCRINIRGLSSFLR